MIATVMLYSLVIGAVLGLGAWAVDVLARRAGIAQRQVWFGALALLVALTLSSPWRGTAPMVELPAAPAVSIDELLPTAPAAFTWTTLVARVGDVFSAPGDALSSLIARGTIAGSTEVNVALAAAWVALSSTLLVVLAFTLRRLDVQRRGLPRAELHGMRVRVGATRGPAVYGVLAPEIVVPSALLMRSAEEQQIVLAHEDEHRRARDPLLLALTAGLVALLPWHPIAWWCASRLRLATELDCDTRVLRRGTSTRRYGALLLAVADSMSSAPRVRHALGLLDSRRHLERRILAMTARPTRRAPIAVGALALVAASAVFAACNTDIPTAAQVRDADAATVVRQLGLPSGSGQVVYYVDGKKMADAQTVPAEQIASIEVRRKRTAGEVSEVYIRTLGAEAEQSGELRRVPYVASKSSDSVRVTLGRTRYVGEEQANAARSLREANAVRALREAEVQVSQFGADSAVTHIGDSIFVITHNRNGTLGVVHRLRSPVVMLRRSDSSAALIRRRGDSSAALIRRGSDSSSALMRRGSDSSSATVLLRGEGSPSVILRGGSAIEAAQPLIIIDGVIATDRNAMNRLNPNTIESIEVLKGEAASKIHGARGANGVILIKTKK